MRTTLGLAIGTDVQTYSAKLADLAGISFAQGDILYWNGTHIVNLGPGTSGQFLKTQGAAANPVWATIAGGGDLLASNNLSDLANAGTALTNLGLSANGKSWVTASNYAAMVALIAAAQADQETASSTSLVVTPGRQQFHPSAAKFWAYVTVSGGTPTLAASYNVTSITDTGVGDLTVTIATDFSSASWAPFVSVNSFGITSNEHYYKTPAAGSVEVTNLQVGVATVDPLAYSIGGFGDQ